MTTREEVPETTPSTQLREGANVVQSLAQLAALKRDMIERRHLEEMRDIQRQQDRAEMLQRQEERDQQRKAEQAERDAERKREQAERDVQRKAEMNERDRQRDEQRKAEQAERTAERKGEQGERDAKMEQRDDSRKAEMTDRDNRRNAEMADREQERRQNRIDQLTGRVKNATHDVNGAIADLAEAERRLEFLKGDAELKHTDLDEALENKRPDWELRRLRDIANRADEEARRGIVAIGKAERRVDAATARYDSELSSLTAATRDFNERQEAAPDPSAATDQSAATTPSPEDAGQEQAAPTGPIRATAERLDTAGVADDRTSAPPREAAAPEMSRELVIADSEGAAALAAAKRVAVPGEGQTTTPAATPPTPATPPAAVVEQTHPRRTR